MGLSLALACGDDASSPYSHDSLAVQDDDALDDEASDSPRGVAEAVPLDCPRGGSTGPVRVDFFCGEITVITCKDLSNVVLELEGGERQRFEGLKGHENTFRPTGKHAGGAIVGVWVKAGNNKSGDGPGYGERVDAPVETCTPKPPPDDCTAIDSPCRPGAPPPPPVDDCTAVDSPCRPGAPPKPPVDDCTAVDSPCGPGAPPKPPVTDGTGMVI
jgi:hypothetical protein